MKNKDFIEYSYKYAYLSFSLIVSFWALSLFELMMITSNDLEQINFSTYLGYKFLNDFWAGFAISLVFFPLYLLFFFLKKSVGGILIKVLFSIIIIGQFALVKYALTTLVNLGADILGYSLNDMTATVSASESFSLLFFLPFVILPLLFLGSNYFFKKLINERKFLVFIIILVMIFGSSKMIFSNASDAAYQNKMFYLSADIYRYQQEKSIADAYILSGRSDYLLLKSFENSEDVLSPFFNLQAEKPNIVIIMVEGLGGEFVGKNDFSGFTPYIDSLIAKSLYWENFISNTGRTFGCVPSLLGSLPYGEKGFLENNPLPSHFSLISVLKANDYTTSFYAGHETSFDRLINFLDYNGIDHIIDQNNFGSDYVVTQSDSKEFSWGYPDSEIYRKTLSELDGKKQPRLDIVMTLTNHEPFEFPSKSNYLAKVDSLLNSKQIFKIEKKKIIAYKEVFASLLYTDKSLENFMKAYAERPDYSNTVFIITGDHRIIPIPQKDKLCRFHVPLIIYSPMLKKAENFKSVSSHWDITPSLLSFLMNNYKFNKLKETSWMSQGLDTARQFRNIHKIPLMRYKGTINDYVYNDYFYAEGELYKINENFEANKVNEPELLKTVSDSLLEFKKLNAYLVSKNKIFPDSLNIYTQPAVQFTKAQLATIVGLTKGLNYDEIFMAARDLAFNKDYKKARLLCDYILNEYPNNADARILKGRTYAWEKNYKSAEEQLLNVLKRKPFYKETYSALMDLYWWSQQDEKALNLEQKAKESEIESVDFSFKLAQAYKRTNNLGKAMTLIDSILKMHPKEETYLTFKNSLK